MKVLNIDNKVVKLVIWSMVNLVFLKDKVLLYIALEFLTKILWRTIY